MHTTTLVTSQLIWEIMLATLWNCINNLTDNVPILGIYPWEYQNQNKCAGQEIYAKLIRLRATVRDGDQKAITLLTQLNN